MRVCAGRKRRRRKDAARSQISQIRSQTATTSSPVAVSHPSCFQPSAALVFYSILIPPHLGFRERRVKRRPQNRKEKKKGGESQPERASQREERGLWMDVWMDGWRVQRDKRLQAGAQARRPQRETDGGLRNPLASTQHSVHASQPVSCAHLALEPIFQ